MREKVILLNILNVKSENKVAQNEPAEFYRRPAATTVVCDTITQTEEFDYMFKTAKR